MAASRTIVRDLNRTREKILAAALAEFSARGFAGARVDAIARRARVNKRMLYYCFGAKQDLYREILRRKIAERSEWLEATPDDFAGALAHIYLSGGADIDFVRLMEWEAIDSGGRKCIAEAERRALFEKAVARLRRAPAQGIDSPRRQSHSTFHFDAVARAVPARHAQVIRLIQGMEPTDPRFMRQRGNFLHWLGDRLAKSAGTIRPASRGRRSLKRTGQLA